MDKQRVKTARPLAKLKQGRNDWYRIENKSDAGAEVFIYDEIGYFGVTADDFVKDLRNLSVDSLDLHINSPGGEVFDGIAIYNAILNHKANVTVYIDGLAASAASFIAMAGDTIKIARNAQMMIHDASGLCIGNSQDMKDLAEMLDRVSDNIADIYMQRAGGDAADWRTAMRETHWYTAQQAVEAGLADEVVQRTPKEEEESEEMTDRWDLSVFAKNQHTDQPLVPEFASRNAQPEQLAPLPEMKAPEVELPPIVESEESLGGGLLALDPAVFRAALRQTTDPLTDDQGTPFAWDPETFRTLLQFSAEHAPAPPSDLPQPKVPTTFDKAFDPDHLRASVRDALINRREETAS